MFILGSGTELVIKIVGITSLDVVCVGAVLAFAVQSSLFGVQRALLKGC